MPDETGLPGRSRLALELNGAENKAEQDENDDAIEHEAGWTSFLSGYAACRGCWSRIAKRGVGRNLVQVLSAMLSGGCAVAGHKPVSLFSEALQLWDARIVRLQTGGRAPPAV